VNNLGLETVSPFDKTVIPGEPNDVGGDPESRKVVENQIILDPGSHPAPRDLAGMTNCDNALKGPALIVPHVGGQCGCHFSKGHSTRETKRLNT